MSAGFVRHADLLAEMPETWRCLICRGPAFAAAQEADALAEMLAETADVEVTFRGKRYQVPSFLVGPSAVEDYLNRQIILCPGCRS